MSRLRIGTATIDVTPEPGLPLMGNFRDDYGARGVHDPLSARAIVFADDRGSKAGLLAVDVCMLDRHNVAAIRRVIGSRCDLPPENVLVHATHTHSGPALSGQLGMAREISRHGEAIEAFLQKAASAMVEANASLTEGTIEIGRVAEDGVSFNRRLRRRDGSTQMNWEALQPGFDVSMIEEPWGPIDPELTCLAFRREEEIRAALVHFALHPAILAGDNWLYSADYPGYVRNALSQSIGNHPACLFVDGCCGDVNHVDYRDPGQGRGFEMAERVGVRLAERAREALEAAAPVASAPLGIARIMVELERLTISTDEQLRCEQILADAESQQPPGQVDGLPDAYFARLRLEMARRQHEPDQVEVMALRVGEVAIVGLPGEAFCELGLEIKRRSPARHTLVAGLCNDAIGYLPTLDAFEQGGYEPMVGSTFYQPGTGEWLVDAAVGQLELLFED